MADTRRTFAALAALFADNTAGAISAQDLRDFLASMKMHVSSSAPTTSDDDTSGFDVGHEWLETSSPAIYKCRSASTGAAVWAKVYPASATVAWGEITGTLADQTDLDTALDARPTSTTITAIEAVTQATYDGLTPDASTLYVITDA